MKESLLQLLQLCNLLCLILLHEICRAHVVYSYKKEGDIFRCSHDRSEVLFSCSEFQAYFSVPLSEDPVNKLMLGCLY